MKEIVLNYWRERFGEFIVHEDKGVLSFRIPAFPEKLMSGNFVQDVNHLHQKWDYLNCLEVSAQMQGYESTDCFKLFIFAKGASAPPVQHLQGWELKWQPLEDAIKAPRFWDYQANNHPEAMNFMKRLLPFLARYRPCYHHFYFEEKGEIVASHILGETRTTNFLFNASVCRSMRKKGLIQQLQASTLQHMPQKYTFYWTKFPWLGLGAPWHLNYQLMRPGVHRDE